MRKIAYYLSEECHKNVIISFCQSERLGYEDLSITGNGKDEFIFFITDREEFLDKVIDKTYKCLISSTVKSVCCCFVINKLSIQSMRILLDYIYHGGSLWNIIPALKFDFSLKECRIVDNNTDVERIVYFMTRDFIHYCTFSEIEKIRIGFSEMLINAIEHGNLAITSNEKFEATEAGTYQELLRKRSADPRYKDRVVYFCVDFNAERILVNIKDEGDGFDINSIPSPCCDEHVMKLHGRGILITRTYFDEVNYNDKGNEVTLLKRFTD